MMAHFDNDDGLDYDDFWDQADRAHETGAGK